MILFFSGTSLPFSRKVNLTTSDSLFVTNSPNLKMEANSIPIANELPISSANISYATYFGGNMSDQISAIFVDPEGNIYVAGTTSSPDFLTTPGAYDEHHNGNFDIFVCKFNSSGKSLEFSTFIGGNSEEFLSKMVVDELGCIYITGKTVSLTNGEKNTFPITSNVVDAIFGGSAEGFACKISPNGDSLLFSTFIGGDGYDNCYDLEIDEHFNIYIVGTTSGESFPTSSGVFQQNNNNDLDGFCMKLNFDASAIIYSTFIGGNDADIAKKVMIDPKNRILIAGTTRSQDFPVVGSQYNSSQSWLDEDIFICVLTANVSMLEHSIKFGGDGIDYIRGFLISSDGSIVVSGKTYSHNFPTTNSSFDTTFNGGYYFDDTHSGYDGYLCIFSTNLSMMLYSSYIGGMLNDEITTIASDSENRVYLTGLTSSANFPVSHDSFNHTLFKAPFLCVFNLTSNQFEYSAVYEMTVSATWAIFLDQFHDIYLGGRIEDFNQFTNENSLNPLYNGGKTDGFLIKIDNPSKFVLQDQFHILNTITTNNNESVQITWESIDNATYGVYIDNRLSVQTNESSIICRFPFFVAFNIFIKAILPNSSSTMSNTIKFSNQNYTHQNYTPNPSTTTNRDFFTESTEIPSSSFIQLIFSDWNRSLLFLLAIVVIITYITILVPYSKKSEKYA